MQSITGTLDVSVANVDQGKVSIEQVDKKMEQMKANVTRSTDNISQITSAIEEQSSASASVSNGISEVATSTTDGVTRTDQIVDAMDKLQAFVNDQILVIAELELPQKVIKLAQSDHVIWKKRLVNMVCGKEGLNDKELADHHSCRLGKWYDQVTDNKLVNNRDFKSLLPPHESVHKHGKQAVVHYNRGDIKSALNEIDEVERASVDVLSLLKALENV